MTMTDLNGKIEDTIITLNGIAPRRSLSNDERFLSDLITAYRKAQGDYQTILDVSSAQEKELETANKRIKALEYTVGVFRHNAKLGEEQEQTNE